MFSSTIAAVTLIDRSLSVVCSMISTTSTLAAPPIPLTLDVFVVGVIFMFPFSMRSRWSMLL